MVLFSCSLNFLTLLRLFISRDFQLRLTHVYINCILPYWIGFCIHLNSAIHLLFPWFASLSDHNHILVPVFSFEHFMPVYNHLNSVCAIKVVHIQSLLFCSRITEPSFWNLIHWNFPLGRVGRNSWPYLASSRDLSAMLVIFME